MLKNLGRDTLPPVPELPRDFGTVMHEINILLGGNSNIQNAKFYENQDNSLGGSVILERVILDPETYQTATTYMLFSFSEDQLLVIYETKFLIVFRHSMAGDNFTNIVEAYNLEIEPVENEPNTYRLEISGMDTDTLRQALNAILDVLRFNQDKKKD